MGCASSSNFPALKTFTCGRDGCADDQFYRYLQTASDTLEVLTVAHSLGARTSQRGFALPRLVGLHVDYQSALLAPPLPTLPSLQALSLLVIDALEQPDRATGVTLSDEIIPLLESVSPTLLHLCINFTITDHCLSIISRLENITTIHFYPHANQFTASALARVANSDPPILPKLAHLRNLRCQEHDHSLHDALFQLIANRNRKQGDGAPQQDSARPSKLLGIDFEKGAPDWLVAEVNRLLKL